MTSLMMSGYGLKKLPTRSVREAARESSDPYASLVSTGNVRPWDLFSIQASCGIPGAREWADRTLDAVLAAALEPVKPALDCEDCIDLGFYGRVDRSDPDTLTALLRRVGDGGYEQLTVSGTWQAYEIVADQQLEILTRELAGDLAEAITAGASGLTRRYFWPAAFLPPSAMIAAVPADQVTAALPETVAVDSQDALDPELASEQGWVAYAVVDDLDPGAVLDLIRLRRGATGPELVAYRNGAWSEAPEILADLQGVQPPPLVELDQAQQASVLEQIGGVPEGSEDSGDPGEGLDEADKVPPLAAAAFGRKTPDRLGALLADAPLTVSPDPRAEKLRRYWTTGKGAAKIRWGTPGDWTRCYRQLRKHMGLRAKGYCQNLHKRATGMWAGDRGNRGGGRAAALAAAGTPAAQSMEVALVAAVSTGRWFCPEGGTTMLKDGIYVEGGENVALLRTLTAGGFPVAPPDEWFENPQLDGPTPLTVDDDGRVYGHIATRDVSHIGLPGRVKAPISKTDYAYFKTGQLVTASGRKVNVGQLTLAGGHAPLQADAAAAVAHYDNTASAVADLNAGDDQWGIWVAGAVRPEVTPSQLRTLRASAPSGDWRPINGRLELVACCQVNVPGFPVVRARVASGAITSLVAAGAGPLYARRLALMADAATAERITALENAVFAQLTAGLEDPSEVIVADGEGEGLDGGEPISEEQAAAEGLEDEDPAAEPEISDAVKRAREAVAARKAAQPAEAAVEATEEPPAPEETSTDPAKATDEDKERADRLAALRARVHGNREPVAASGS